MRRGLAWRKLDDARLDPDRRRLHIHRNAKARIYCERVARLIEELPRPDLDAHLAGKARVGLDHEGVLSARSVGNEPRFCAIGYIDVLRREADNLFRKRERKCHVARCRTARGSRALYDYRRRGGIVRSLNKRQRLNAPCTRKLVRSGRERGGGKRITREVGDDRAPADRRPCESDSPGIASGDLVDEAKDIASRLTRIEVRRAGLPADGEREGWSTDVRGAGRIKPALSGLGDQNAFAEHDTEDQQVSFAVDGHRVRLSRCAQDGRRRRVRGCHLGRDILGKHQAACIHFGRGSAHIGDITEGGHQGQIRVF